MKTIGRIINSKNLLLAVLGISTIFVLITSELIAEAEATNSAPKAVGAVPGVSLEVEGNSETVNISSYFTDDDGDVLSYLAASADGTVSTVSISGVEVTITPIGVGTTTATIVASDGSMTTTQDIAVTVTPIHNRAPVAMGSIDSIVLKVDAQPANVNVANSFSDPDGDALHYQAESSDENSVVVDVLGTVVTITPISVGTTNVSVTASDAAGLTATQSIEVKVEEGNRAPVALGVISDITLAVGVGVVTINVGENFSDPDGQALTFTAASTDASVATVGVSGAEVTITPIGVGTTTATVVASDGSLTATQVVALTVTPMPNRAPEAVGSIDNITLKIDALPASVNVANSFSDPDGDALYYQVTSSDTSKATANVLGTVVTITPVSTGISSVTVTASDNAGLTATQTFDVEVVKGNSAPTAVGSISDIALTVGGNSGSVDVVSNFSDPDNDVLTYTATSADDDVATVSVSGTEVVITPVGVGTTTVAVVASDANGLAATQTIAVIVEVPINTAKQVQLLPNYPSPFNPDTWIPFRLEEDTKVTVTIYDAGGNLVRTFELGYLSAGSYESKGRAVYWDGRNDFGELMASGVYFYELSTPTSSVIRKTSIRK